MDAHDGSAATRSPTTQTRAQLSGTLDVPAAGEVETAAALVHAKGEILGLRDALHSRTQIGQAVGMLMAEKGLSSDEAFAELVETSSHSKAKLRDVAARMVELADAHAERRRNRPA